eukprot:2499639-Amphidinium_carterae.2
MFLSSEEPRLTTILKKLQTIHNPITDWNAITGSNLEVETERFTSLSKVILHRLLSMICGYETWRQLSIKYFGGSVARQYTNPKPIMSVTHPYGEITTTQVRCSNTTLNAEIMPLVSRRVISRHD